MKALLSAFLFLTLLFPFSSGAGPDMCWTCDASNCRGAVFGGCRPGTRQKICYSKVVDFPWEGANKHTKIHNILGCMSAPKCHPVRYTATLPDDGYIYLEVKCCDQWACNKPISVPAQMNRPLNGLQCPGCRTSRTNESCSSETTVDCHGKENMCISYTGNMRKRGHLYHGLSFKGCATKNLCDLLTGASKKGSDLLKPSDTTEAECSSAEFSAEDKPYPEQ